MAEMTELKDPVTEAAPKEKMVKIKLPLTRAEKEDVFVGVNGRTYLIQRGKEVSVPASVAEVLQHSEEVLMQAMEYMEQANNLTKEDQK